MGKILKPYAVSKHRKDYVEGMEIRYLRPRRVKDLLEAKMWMENELQFRGLPVSRRKLKKLLRKDILSEGDRDLASAYLKYDSIARYARKARFTPVKYVKNLKNKVKFSIKTQIRRSANEGSVHVLTGAFVVSKLARTGIKALFRSVRTSYKAAKFMIPKVKTVRKALSKTGKRIRTGYKKVKSTGSFNDFKRIRSPRTRKAFGRAGSRGAKRVFHFGDILSGMKSSFPGEEAAKISAGKAAKVSAKAAAKAPGKAAELLAKTVKVTVHFAVRMIGAVLPLIGPVGIIAIILVVALVSMDSVFETDSGTYYDNVRDKTVQEKEADDELSIQQYVDILVKCHENYKEKLEELYQDPSYETVSVTFRDRKNNAVTNFYEDASKTSNSIETGNNIKEIMSMASTLFGFNYEGYASDSSKWGWASDVININKNSKKDRKKLEEFLESNGMDPSQYRDTTYQKLIRSYLIGLFNGSHTTTKKIEITYCGGCEITDVDEEGNAVYTCPGHRHLYLSVITYYFDDIFACRLKAKSDLDTYSAVIPSVSVAGSGTIEKLWNGMKSAGYSDEAAAGAIGNLMWESGGGPSDVKLNAVESTGVGIGMCQWSGGRKTKFLNFLASRGIPWPNEDVAVQLEFMLYELNNGEWLWVPSAGFPSSMKCSLEEFKKCTDVTKAAQYFCANFERPGIPHMEERISYAKGVYNTYHNKTMVQNG